MLVLFTDTDTDITPEEAKHFGYKVISMPYTAEGKEVYPYVDFDEFDYHTFYEKMRGGLMPTTSGLSPENYRNYFEPVLKEGNDILYVHFSAVMSGTFSAMHIAIRELKEEYPDRNIYLVDTKGITICSNLIVKEIGDLYLAGKTAEEILEWAKTEVDKFAVYFYADNLKFFARSGRVSGIAAFFGGIIGIKPIIYMGSDGKMASIGKGKGRVKTLEKLVEYVVSLQDDIRSHRIIIGHADALELAQMLGKMITDKLGEGLNIEYVVVNPTAGSHCGPDTVGVCFHAIHR
jgi:DegV family protein with EDD domain